MKHNLIMLDVRVSVVWWRYELLIEIYVDSVEHGMQ